MIVEQLYTNCLSEAAYFIADDGEAAVVDPLRDIEAYVDLAAKHNAKIKYIFETHFHADFVSGHLDLARATGATIVYGPQTNAAFKFHLATDGEIFSVGNLRLKALHTPGHTLESTCYLLFDEEGREHCVFTGDTLFVGDVGRPDLFSGNLSKEQLASMLYDSLNNKIRTLPDHVIVYPAHGPGSACGKNLGKETFSTIATQKATNYALKEQSREDFVTEVTSGLNTPPAYFPINAQLNAQGYESLDKVRAGALQALSVEAFEEKAKAGAWILDSRPSSLFTEGFVPESISIGLDGRFAEWAGSLLPFDKELVLVTEAGKEEETVIRLARVGLDKIAGYLDGGFDAWQQAGKTIDLIIDVEPEELAMDIPFDNKLQVIDVRKPSEFESGHVKGAENIPLSELGNPLHMAQIDDDANLYVHCAGGYRSVIACSLMKREGFHNLRNVLGGFGKMKEVKGMPVVKPSAAGA
ncbi:MBL fold metallo-hydrolase [Taibaiella koreensis]|uniref:MBL fold metallo-hydrolase n=1 Tax=Taibaiella koreensis TaxID=1268548 RepID=UPI000E59A382|nr:MBL fold metallo-hydrolase [Taibaiella koreensis]